MEIIFSNVDVDVINFVNNRHDIKVDFFDTTEMNKYCRKISRKVVWRDRCGNFRDRFTKIRA